MRKSCAVLLVFLSFLTLARTAWGVSCTDPPAGATSQQLQEIIDECSRLVEETHKTVNSLSQEVALMDNQIKITLLKITQTEDQIKTLEEDIATLSGKIDKLDISLNDLSRVLLSRVAETYKQGKADSFLLLFSSKSFSEFVDNYRYLQAVQLRDREMLLMMEQTRVSYDEQKQLKEKKQADLEKLETQLQAQKVLLDSQKAERKKLLEETKGKEAIYQQLLANAKSELEAILGILEGKGNEKEIRKVAEGEKIATIISGASCNSNGTHLHFMVSKDGKTYNPFDFLKGGLDFINCSGSSCGSSDGDPFNPHGDWSWPINSPIRLTQGYGSTWAITHTWVGRIYSFHNGIDLQSSSLEVKAVRAGTLYWGSYVGRCILRYVKVHHDDGYDTLYLHVNY